MSTSPYNSLEFCWKTKALEEQFYQSAISEAEALAKSEKRIFANRDSDRICQTAFTALRTNLETDFPDDDYRALIDLTLKSRENLFFVDLRECIKNILRNQVSV